MKKGIFFAAALSATPDQVEEVQRSIDEAARSLAKLSPEQQFVFAVAAESVGVRMIRKMLSKAGPEGEISGRLGEKVNI